MNDTIIYLIRHAETVDENGIRNTNEDSQMINEKEILSVEGEEQARNLSENIELKNIDVLWSSSYTRAKATAKYIAKKNNLPINLDGNLISTVIDETTTSSTFITQSLRLVFQAVVNLREENTEQAIFSLIPDIVQNKTLDKDGFQYTSQNNVTRFSAFVNKKQV